MLASRQFLQYFLNPDGSLDAVKTINSALLDSHTPVCVHVHMCVQAALVVLSMPSSCFLCLSLPFAPFLVVSNRNSRCRPFFLFPQ